MHHSIHHASQKESYINFVCSVNRRHFTMYNQFIINLYMTYSYPLILSPDYDLVLSWLGLCNSTKINWIWTVNLHTCKAWADSMTLLVHTYENCNANSKLFWVSSLWVLVFVIVTMLEWFHSVFWTARRFIRICLMLSDKATIQIISTARDCSESVFYLCCMKVIKLFPLTFFFFFNTR